MIDKEIPMAASAPCLPSDAWPAAAWQPPCSSAHAWLIAAGVGKGTYSTRVSDYFGLCHIASGDLVREEMRKGTDIGKEVCRLCCMPLPTASCTECTKPWTVAVPQRLGPAVPSPSPPTSPLAAAGHTQMDACVRRGDLLPDALILRVIRDHFAKARSEGSARFLLDGFPRTAEQAAALDAIADVGLAVNLGLREEVLVEKCLGRRLCTKCGKNYNIADIYLPATADGQPEIVMPPLSPPPECAEHLEQRADDTEPVIRRRLEVYRREAQPVERFYEQRGQLLDFEITGGIPQVGIGNGRGWARACIDLDRPPCPAAALPNPTAHWPLRSFASPAPRRCRGCWRH